MSEKKTPNKEKRTVNREALTEFVETMQKLRDLIPKLGLSQHIEGILAMKLDEAYLWAVGFIEVTQVKKEESK